MDELFAAHREDDALTIRTGRSVRVDFTSASIECGGKHYSFAPLGAVAQELIVGGGLEPVIRQRIAQIK